MSIKLSTAIAALAVGIFATPALSADIYGNGSSKDAPGDFSAPQVFSWSGLYVGGRLGYGNANHDLTVEKYRNAAEAVPASCTGGALNSGGTACTTPGTFTPAQAAIPAVPASAANCTGGVVNTAGTGCVLNIGTFNPAVAAVPGVAAVPSACPGGVLNSGGTACTVVGAYNGPVAAITAFTDEIFGVDGVSSAGITGGGQVGFDIQRGRFVGGIFGSYDLSGMETEVSLGGTDLTAIEKGDEWSVGVRAGLLVNPRTLAYVLAAYTQTEYTFAGLGADGDDKDVSFSGITAGAGVEFAVTNNIFMGIEGTHTFYGKETLADSCSEHDSCGEPGARGIRILDEIGETKVMGTLKIKLNSGLPNFVD